MCETLRPTSRAMSLKPGTGASMLLSFFAEAARFIGGTGVGTVLGACDCNATQKIRKISRRRQDFLEYPNGCESNNSDKRHQPPTTIFWRWCHDCAADQQKILKFRAEHCGERAARHTALFPSGFYLRPVVPSTELAAERCDRDPLALSRTYDSKSFCLRRCTQTCRWWLPAACLRLESLQALEGEAHRILEFATSVGQGVYSPCHGRGRRILNRDGIGQGGC